MTREARERGLPRTPREHARNLAEVWARPSDVETMEHDVLVHILDAESRVASVWRGEIDKCIAAARAACAIVNNQPGIGSGPLADYIEAAIRGVVK